MNTRPRHLLAPLFVALFAMVLLAGCAAGPRDDPWQPFNRSMYNFNNTLDKYAMKPIAAGYVKIVPKPVRTCVSNGMDNLVYGDVILNDFLQGKLKQGCADSGRMLVNTTIGVAGIFDVATPLGLASHENDLGITLAKWGVPQGPFLMLPFYGPSTLRDAPDLATTAVTDPMFWINPPLYVWIPMGMLRFIDDRSRYDKWIRFRDETAIDGYLFSRDGYLQYRNNLIHGGKTRQDQSIYDENLDDTPSSGPASRPVPSSQPETQPANPIVHPVKAKTP